MFKITPPSTFSKTVPLSVPGLVEAGSLVVTYRHKTATALREWLGRASGGAAEAGVLEEILSGWKGLQDDAGEDIEYSPENLRRLLDNHPSAGACLFEAYTSEMLRSKVLDRVAGRVH